MDEMNELTKNKKPIYRKIAQRDKRTLFCPKCKQPLIVAFDRDIEVDTCEKCKGIWVDYVGEKQLLHIKLEVFSIDELKRLRKLYKPLGRIETSGYVPCPVCRELMYRRNWGSYSGVIVDKCSEHGTWYDEGELEKIREYVSLGGIEYEKYKLDEKGLDEVNHKLFQEVYRLDKRIDSAYMRARLYGLMGF